MCKLISLPFCKSGFFAVLLLVLVSCSTTKNLPPKPQWLLSRPQLPGYYTGIGSALITSNRDGFHQSAKYNALKDLAGEISMTVSNTSFLHTLEVNNQSSETYDSRTQTTVNEDLEGYTQVAEFEDQNTYYVFYQLSKSLYEQQKQQRIQKALGNALAKYTTALDYHQKGEVRQAFLLLVKAVEDIKPYWTEPLQTQINDRDIYFGNELYNEIFTLVNDLKITALHNEIKVKRGQAVGEKELRFFLATRDGKSSPSVPVKADFSSNGLINDKARSDERGEAGFVIPKIRSKRTEEYFTAQPDLMALLQEASSDYSVRMMLRNFTLPKASIKIQIAAPVFKLEYVSYNTEIQQLIPVCEQYFISENCVVSDTLADFRLVLDCNTRKAAGPGMETELRVKVLGADGKIVYQRSSGVLGSVQLNSQLAYQEVFSAAKDYLQKRILPDLSAQLF